MVFIMANISNPSNPSNPSSHSNPSNPSSPSNPSNPSKTRKTRKPRTPVYKGKPSTERDPLVDAVVDHIYIILDHALRDIRQSKGLSNSELANILDISELMVSRICSDTNSDEHHLNCKILVRAYYAGLIDIHATLNKAKEEVVNPEVRQQWEEIDARYKAVRDYKNEQKKKKRERDGG